MEAPEDPEDTDQDGEGLFYLSELRDTYAPDMPLPAWYKLFAKVLQGHCEGPLVAMQLASQQPPYPEPRIYELTLSPVAHGALMLLLKEPLNGPK